MSVWRTQSNALFAEAWEDLARGFVVRSPQLAALAGANDYWRPAGRWWQGSAHELDVVSVSGSGTRTLVGEAKWSDRAFSRQEAESLVRTFEGIPVPDKFPQDVRRVLFLSSVTSGVPSVIGETLILTAEDIVSSSRP